MAPRFTYTAPGDWSEILATNVRLGTLGLVSRAEMGDVGISSIVLDNPDATLGHASDDIVGFKQFLVDELEEDAGDQRVYSSFIGRRQYRRGQDKALRQGIGHEVEATLSDRNWLLTLSIVTGTDGVRPAETVTARVAWLLGSTYLATVVDIGYVDSTLTTAMSAVDYRGQKPIDVLGDCANQAKVNFWVGYDEYADVDWLWFADSNTSLLYDSGCFISDDPADIDLAAIRAGTASVFAGTPADTLDRDPERVFSGQYRPYAKGNVYVTDGAIAAAFIARDGSAPDANIKTAAVATAVATADLAANDEEDDRITRTILVHAKQANAIKHGQLVQIRSTWMPGYVAWVNTRVLTKTLTQLPSGDRSLYTMTLELSPALTSFTGDAFAALLDSNSSAPDLNFTATGDTQPVGWYPEPSVDGVRLSFVQSGDPYSQILSTERMLVRIEGAVFFSAVVSGSFTVTLWATVDGINVGSTTFSSTGGLRFESQQMFVDVHNVLVQNGSIIELTNNQPTLFWDGFTVNNTYLRVGRGTFAWDSGAVHWTGP